jgi:hypothetical protein
MTMTSARLTAEETVLLLLYRTVSEQSRARARRVLFDAWTDPLAGKPHDHMASFREASEELGEHLGLSSFAAFVD